MTPNIDFSAVLFDFGDTLVTLPIPREELFTRAAQSIGLQLNIEAVRRAYQIVDFNHKYSSISIRDRAQFYRQYNERICEALGISNYFEHLLPAVTNEFSRNRGWVLFNDSETILKILSLHKVTLGIVANWDSNLPDVVARLGIRDFFSTIVASHSAGSEKPDPAIFRIALEELSLTNCSEKVLYVGNEYKADVIGSRSAGLVPVLIDRVDHYEHADCLRFGSLLEWLSSLDLSKPIEL